MVRRMIERDRTAGNNMCQAGSNEKKKKNTITVIKKFTSIAVDFHGDDNNTDDTCLMCVKSTRYAL